MTNVLVSVDGVGKKFCRSLMRGMQYTASDVGRDMLGLPSQADFLRPGEFWAVDGVSLQLRQGECLGLIGANGAGKSSLLKLLNGIVLPDRGKIEIRGRVGALIEVGAGFHPMLTGRENVYVNGAILGMKKSEIDAKYDEIVAFSGLEADILEAPVKSYSSGMYVRLGFAVAVHTEPDVLLVDEVLAVGDIRFIGRCREKIDQLRRRGTSMILVSHNLALIEDSCDRGMFMAKGRVMLEGTARAATTAYRQFVRDAVQDERIDGEVSPVQLLSGDLYSDAGKPVSSLVCGDIGTLELLVSTRGRVDAGYFCLWAVSEDDQQVTGVGYLTVGRDIEPFSSGVLRIKFKCQMMPGNYRLGVTYSGDGQFQLGDELLACAFTVEPWNDNTFRPSGIFRMDVWQSAQVNEVVPESTPPGREGQSAPLPSIMGESVIEHAGKSLTVERENS